MENRTIIVRSYNTNHKTLNLVSIHLNNLQVLYVWVKNNLDLIFQYWHSSGLKFILIIIIFLISLLRNAITNKNQVSVSHRIYKNNISKII